MRLYWIVQENQEIFERVAVSAFHLKFRDPAEGVEGRMAYR